MTSDDDRVAYLAGDGGASLDANERADLDEVRELLADPSVWADADPALEDRIVAAITAEAAGAPAAATGAATTAAARPRGAARRRTRAVYGFVTAVAAAVAVIATTLALAGGSTDSATFAAAMAGTDLARGASGSATFTQTASGWRVELHATGLPRLDDGRFYEAWMKNRDGVLVPIGTFNEGPVVTMWSGVSPSSFPAITVTEQEANGNPASSGRRVLTGDVTETRSP
jgi:hypothetical protein